MVMIKGRPLKVGDVLFFKSPGEHYVDDTIVVIREIAHGNVYYDLKAHGVVNGYAEYSEFKNLEPHLTFIRSEPEEIIVDGEAYV